MKTKQLGSTDLHLSVIGLGAWAIGGTDWGLQNDNESIATILRAQELGVNWIDTSSGYGFGHSEEIVGKTLKQARGKLIISTKCGWMWNDKNELYQKLDKKSVTLSLEASLKRLDIEAIDLYQIHWPMPDEEVEEAWETLIILKKAGKIKHIGACNFSVKQMERIKPMHKIASLQPPYNMFSREIEKQLLKYCDDNKMGIISYSPMGRGLLTGKYTKEKVNELSESDHRKNKNDFKEPQLSINRAFLDGISPIAKKNGVTLSQLAIAWVLRRPEITAAIVGARRPDQIEETAIASESKLSKDDVLKIEGLLTERSEKLKHQG